MWHYNAFGNINIKLIKVLIGEEFMNSENDIQENKTLGNKIRTCLTSFIDKCISKSPNPVNYIKNKKASSIAQIYFEINFLKELYRQGWLNRGIPKEKCESVAEHIYGVAMLSFIIAEQEFPELDVNKVVKMALLHEIGEIYGGDITPDQNVSEVDKHKIELASVKKVLSKLDNGKKYIGIWKEFERGETKESKFVRQIDKLECGMQAVIYNKQEYPRMNEYFQYTLDKLELEKLKDLMNEIINL